MANIELYINKELCDIGKLDSFSVYLKRQLLNPAELNTKDAQRSYDITLPASAVNNRIFGHINVEETKGKFARLYDALLLVNGIAIFEGKFKLNEITKHTYKGNLGIPAQKTVKDIFGDKMMNQAGEWRIDFKDIKDMSVYNKDENPECFFPLVLYGLLPKDVKADGRYSDKDEIDDTLALAYGNIPPSINSIQALKQIFASEGYTLDGSACNDERINKLYMSYKNPESYPMPWNYGTLAKMELKGTWSNLELGGRDYPNGRAETVYTDNSKFRNVNILQSANLIINELSDSGVNIGTVKKEYQGREVSNYFITIPHSGLYKIQLDADIKIEHMRKGLITDSGTTIVSYDYSNPNSNFLTNRFEIEVLRRKANGEDIDLRKVGFDNSFYNSENLPQEDNDDSFPKYFPAPGGVNFVDLSHNPYLLCGLSFGKHTDRFPNPIDKENLYCNPVAIRGGKSWRTEDEFKNDYIYAATNCPVYYKMTSRDVFEETSVYTVNLKNTPFENQTSINDSYNQGNGKICQIAWLEKDDQITLVMSSDLASYGRWVYQNISFGLSVQAFRDDKDWITVDESGTGTADMDWGDDASFLTDKLDLTKFLPSDIKVDEWINNFCKTFNLQLVQTGERTFELNTKETKVIKSTKEIDLDTKTEINVDRRNGSLGIPSAYELGFTIDKNERGYRESLRNPKDILSGETGGGLFQTGSIETSKITQTSSFSYNWLKKITDTRSNKELMLPIISDNEVWMGSSSDYREMMGKSYFSKAQRFWYKDKETFKVKLNRLIDIEAGLVKNSIEGVKPMVLNYKNERYSILDNYFTLFTSSDNSYTTVTCFLSPDEYSSLPYSWIKLNGDLYYVAEIDGYDPLGRKKASLKLIRKTL